MSADIQSLFPAVFGRLKNAKPSHGGARAAALCPAHEDRNRSLALSLGSEGRLLVKCFAGCKTEAVVEALGLKLTDLFERRDGKTQDEKQTVETVYPYTDGRGEVLYECVRLKPKGFYYRRPDGRGGWIRNIDGQLRVPFNLDSIKAAPPQTPVCVVEGEKKAALLSFFGFLGTCNPGGAGKWPPGFAQIIKGRAIAIFPDNDEMGWQHAFAVAKTMAATNGPVRIVELPGLRLKEDICDWYERVQGDATMLVHDAIDAAPIFWDEGDAALKLKLLQMGVAKLLTMGHYI